MLAFNFNTYLHSAPCANTVAESEHGLAICKIHHVIFRKYVNLNRPKLPLMEKYTHVVKLAELA